jgi:3-oxoadipate enol-lactonase
MSGARYVDAAGTRVYLQEWTAADGDSAGASRSPGAAAAADLNAPTLLCLHGLGGGSHFFSALGPALARTHGWRTLAIDFPGSGLSPFPAALSVSAAASARRSASDSAAADVAGPNAPSRPAAPSPDLFALFADLVADLVRREGLTKPYLLGHSMGTIVALDAIRQAPDLAGGLIVVGGLAAPLPDARGRILARAAEIRRDGAFSASMGRGVVAANFARRTQDERPELTGMFAQMFAMQQAASYAATAEALARVIERPVPAQALAHLPCLVIAGDEDRYAPPDAIREFARALPAGTAVEIMRECGHLPFLEQPAAFAALVGRFLTARP